MICLGRTLRNKANIIGWEYSTRGEVGLKSGKHDDADTGQRLSLAGGRLGHFHICAFFSSRDEQDQVLGPFYREALRQDEQLLHLVEADSAEDHRARLARLGVDVSERERSGQLSVLPWERISLDVEGRFDKSRTLAAIDRLTGADRATRFRRLRVVGQMGWMRRATVDPLDVMEYAAEVNEVLARNRQPAICVHDIATLDGATMMDLLRTHPLTLIDGRLQENPFFTPPTEMLRELGARRGRGVDARDQALR